MLQKAGLLSWAALVASCGYSDSLVKRNQEVQVKSHCIINSDTGERQTPVSTHAVDTNGNRFFDEAFVTREYQRALQMACNGQ